jgi:hypothetical protein
VPIADFYRGNTRDFKFQFHLPNPAYTGEPPFVSVTAAGTGDYDHICFPLGIDSSGVVTQNWTLTFYNKEEFTITGGLLANVGEGNITCDAHPNNPLTNTPYFTLLKAGWVANKIWQAGDIVTFSTISVTIPEDITDLEVELTFIEEDAVAATVQTSAVAGGNPADNPTEGLMVLRLESGDSASLVADQYVYGFERRVPHATNVDFDDVRTIEVGKVKILTPAKVIVP